AARPAAGTLRPQPNPLPGLPTATRRAGPAVDDGGGTGSAALRVRGNAGSGQRPATLRADPTDDPRRPHHLGPRGRAAPAGDDPAAGLLGVPGDPPGGVRAAERIPRPHELPGWVGAALPGAAGANGRVVAGDRVVFEEKRSAVIVQRPVG